MRTAVGALDERGNGLLRMLFYRAEPPAYAEIAAGQRFVGWSGACSGTAQTCNVNVTRDTQVQAVFSK